MKRIVCLIFVLLLFVSGSAFAAKRVALVIGNGGYASAPLRNPVNDASDMAAKLRGLGFDVTLLKNADQRKMERSIRAFGDKLSSASIRLFYYAGHGMQVQGANYLIPVGSEILAEDEVRFDAVDAERVLAKMRNARGGVNVMILDACRNNPFSRSFRSASRGLKRMDAPIGTLLVYATSPGSVAADGKGRNGIFTKHLLKHLGTQGVALDDVMRRVRKGVVNETDQQQIPWMNTSLLDEVFLVGGVMVADGSPTPPVSSSGYASIKIESEPSGATVYINDTNRGRTPVNATRLKPGRVRVRLEKVGYSPVERTISVSAGQTVYLPLTMDGVSRKARLTVNADLSGAKIRILNIGPAYRDGIELKPGKYHVEVSKFGYTTFRRWVDLTQGQNLVMPVSLRSSSVGSSAASPSGSSRPGAIWKDPTTGMSFVFVSGGCYQMGSNSGDDDEKPVHEVCVDGFWMGKYEVTRGQFRKFVNATGYKTDAEKKGKAYIFNKSTDWEWKEVAGYDWRKVGYAQDDRHPAATISWNDAKAYIKWMQSRSGGSFRLPTEAEWEYAARAGSTSKWFWGDDPSKACKSANTGDKGAGFSKGAQCDDKQEFTAPVGTYRPNSFGLYDMSGNVYEWCEDWHDSSAYSKHSRNNPVSKNRASGERVLRGGSWYDDPWNVRSAVRSWSDPDGRVSSFGFRVIRLPQE